MSKSRAYGFSHFWLHPVDQLNRTGKAAKGPMNSRPDAVHIDFPTQAALQHSQYFFRPWFRLVFWALDRCLSVPRVNANFPR